MSEKELLELKEEINEAKKEVAEYTGRNAEILSQIKQEFGCKNIKETKAKMTSLELQIEKYSESIEEGIQELETLLSNNEEE